MARKGFDDLIPGDVIADMHEGIDPIRAKFAIVSCYQWPIDREDPASWQPFASFQNKYLRVLGRTNADHVVCGYQYDGGYAGIVVLARKE